MAMGRGGLGKTKSFSPLKRASPKPPLKKGPPLWKTRMGSSEKTLITLPGSWNRARFFFLGESKASPKKFWFGEFPPRNFFKNYPGGPKRAAVFLGENVEYQGPPGVFGGWLVWGGANGGVGVDSLGDGCRASKKPLFKERWGSARGMRWKFCKLKP